MPIQPAKLAALIVLWVSTATPTFVPTAQALGVRQTMPTSRLAECRSFAETGQRITR